jgi:hypothetical protein
VGLNKLKWAVGFGMAAALAYVILSYANHSELNFKGQAPLVAVSVFSLVTSVALLLDLLALEESKLGDLAKEKNSLIIGLIFVVIYVPISLGDSFLDVMRASPASASGAKSKPAE